MTRFALAAAVALWNCVASAQVLPVRYLLTGSLRGETVQLELTLTTSPTNQGSEHVSGRLLSTPPKPLTGRVAENGDLRLQGVGLSTLTLHEHLSDPVAAAQPAFTGTTGSGDVFDLELVASYTAQRLTQGPFLEASWSAPYFLAPPWRQVNRTLQNTLRVPAATFIREAQELLEEGALRLPHAFDSQLEVSRLTPNVLSLLERRYTYTGGAHPNTGYRSLTFQNAQSKVTRVALNDLFRDGTAYRRVLLGEVTRKLRARRAAWIKDGSVVLTVRDLGVFTLTGRGLEFVFAPYAVGPYAQGAFFVTVPYGELQGLLKPFYLP